MNLNDIYDLIPWDVLRRWAEAVGFDDGIVNPHFPKYETWSEKAIYADYLMDYVDEGFNYANVSYTKAGPLKEGDLWDKNFLEMYKLFFDSSVVEERSPDAPERMEWEKRLKEMAEYLKKSYGPEIR